ncbi:MAG TPA: SusC/RagA family TonB-linked outer membrane protein [Paludibacteraceae bacterium]|nr:SusC/RagA family TonB-linked outer membrane protein [Paludibacteraceae bacterium]HPT42613.1 SusC/RagA family TonB-linked outer membrane protein [Paludibacteraceae bacterium]
MRIGKYIIPFLLLCVVNYSTVNAQAKDNFTYSVSGIVKSAETQKPLSGIRIAFKDMETTLTNNEGHFSMNLPSGNVNLTVSGPGYVSKVISVKGRKDIAVELYTEGFRSVFENVTTPQGISSPVELTHTWSAINENNILSTAITSDEALQGKVSGLNLIHHSGALAAGSNIYIRGLNSMNAGIQPLIIVDGMPYENTVYSTSLLGNYFSNPLASIDIKDIENITVLKDGTSQYGVKGANGVILIRTLKAKEMGTKINFHLHTGVNLEPLEIPVLNATDHKLLISDMLQSTGMSGSQIMNLPYMNMEKPVNQKWGYEGNVDYYRYNNNTNWQKEIYNLSYNQDYYMNVFGGDEVAVYALAVGYMSQDGIVKNTSFERFNTRFNAEVNLSKKLKLFANMSFLFSNRKLIDEGPSTNRNPLYAALVKAPFMASHVNNPEGAVSPVIEDADVFNNSNPYSLVNTSSRDNSLFRFVGNFEAKYDFNKHLKFNAILGVNFNKEREKLYFPNRGVYFDTLSIGPVDNVSQHRVDRLSSIYTEAALSYTNLFNLEHKLDIRGGMRNQTNQAQDDWGKTANTGSDSFKSISYGDPLYRVIGGQISNWNWLNLFATVDYGFRDKYFLNYTMSADASSRYGREANPFCLYPSASAAWLISGEEFMKDASLFDLLKLRIGYGLSGNDEIGNYNGVQYYIPQSLLGSFGLVRGNLVDLNLRPEKTAKMNAGVDASFLNERINFSIDVYKNNISDMILRIPTPRETGFPFYLTNAGKMSNTGIDFSLKSRILNGTLKWDAGFVASVYKNKVTDLKNEEYITEICNGYVLTRVGQPLGVFYGYKTDGVYATQAEAANEGLMIQKGGLTYPFSAGDMRFVNTDNTNKLIDENDRVIIGDPNPDLFGSVFTDLKYKNWSLNVFCTYSLGNDIYNYTRAQLESMKNFDNQIQAVLNRWKTEGDMTDIPRAAYGDPMGNARFSDRWIEDGSYLRLKSVTLSYQMPFKSDIIRSCTIFASGDNLATLTGYKGLDPEFALGQSPLYNGIDATFVPFSRTLSVGVKLDL